MKKKNINVIIIALAALQTFPLLARRSDAAAAAGTNTSKSALAVVAIPSYVDATGSQNYGYLSQSLTDAVDASMQEKFDYARANKGSVEGETKKLWKPNRIPSDLEIRQIATSTRSDYVVVGSYSLSANKKQIIFNTRIYIAPDKFIDVAPFTNNADATLFDATNKVATEIVRAIETDAIARATAKKENVKAGEKISLSKVSEEKPKESNTSDDDNVRSSDRYVGVGLGYNSNTIERHTQFYQYPSSSFGINAELRLTPIILIYGKLLLPQTPSGGAIFATYANKGNQTIGFEVGDRHGDYIFGMNFRNFSDVNPAGIYARDLAGWSSSAYMKSHFSFFHAWDLYFGLDLDSYLDIYSTKVDAIKDDNLKLLWNLEAAFTVSYFIPVVKASLTGLVGSAFSILDSTGQFLIGAPGATSWDTTTRNGILTGIRYGLELEKRFYGVALKVEGYVIPSVAGKFQPRNEFNAQRTSYAFMTFSAGYRFGF